MKQIASCFLTRMKKKKRLESCATAIYLSPKNKKKLVTLKDTKKKTEHNTYQFHGLPPFPICMAGKDALEAALEATDTFEYLYFSHCLGKFFLTKDYKEHIANKNKCKLQKTTKSNCKD